MRDEVAIVATCGIPDEGSAGDAKGLALIATVGRGDGSALALGIVVGGDVGASDCVAVDVAEDVVGCTGCVACGNGLGRGSCGNDYGGGNCAVGGGLKSNYCAGVFYAGHSPQNNRGGC